MDIPRTILFDFDGVLCHDRFYGNRMQSQYPNVYDWIQQNIFGKDSRIVKDWMRRKISAREVNRIIAENTGIEKELLHGMLVDSVKEMKIDERMMEEAGRLKRSRCKLCLVTDNMDVFTEITVGNHKLNNLFDGIVNSADHGCLKKDENGKLFDIALSMVGEGDIEHTLLIDDSADAIELYRKKGGNAHHYRNFDEFMKESLCHR